MSDILPFSGITRHGYPEPDSAEQSGTDLMVGRHLGSAFRWLRVRPGRFRGMVTRVHAWSDSLKGMDEDELKTKVRELGRQLSHKEMRIDDAALAFALVREFSWIKLRMRHFDTQIIGGWVLLNGMVAEMETGEGKTLTATLPACTAALARIPVHIITVNDYLAARDAEWMGPIYKAMGLSVGVVTQGMRLEERRNAYRCDITYGSNKAVAFDYLKDRLLMGRDTGPIRMRVERLYRDNARIDRLCLRGLCFAIVDEVDSVLIDEARTPLIISGPGAHTGEADIYQKALELAGCLRESDDYTLDSSHRKADLTDEGKERVRALSESLTGIWRGTFRRETLVRQALAATHLFVKDRDYLVKQGKVQIIDEYTGRLMSDRSWEGGIHQMIEIKEGCEMTPQNETLARISFQRFFRRYRHLAGMTGTAKEVARELWSVYRLYTVSIPSQTPIARREYRAMVYADAATKWDAVVTRIAELHARGRPVLAGTRSVKASEYLSQRLSDAGLPHQILNARQDQEEAQIIAQAGRIGQITVATNMAGRGTDIRLTPEVRELGGLHVIATERHDARRIDRQLFGRCGRQGDPGSFESVAALTDDLFAPHLETLLGRIVLSRVKSDHRLGRCLGNLFAWYAQWTVERKHFYMRRDLMKLDESVARAMAFSGPGEG